MRVKYVGESFGVDGLTNGKIYQCINVEGAFLRIIDDSNEDYLYSINRPASLEEPDKSGKWLIIEDSNDGILEEAFSPYSDSLAG